MTLELNEPKLIMAYQDGAFDSLKLLRKEIILNGINSAEGCVAYLDALTEEMQKQSARKLGTQDEEEEEIPPHQAGPPTDRSVLA